MAGYDRVSPPRRPRIPHDVAALVRGLHPVLKRKVRAALQAVLEDPYAGKALCNELQGLRSYRVGRFRIIYRIGREVELVAFGPRDAIYLETYRQLHEPRGRYRHETGSRPGGTNGDARADRPTWSARTVLLSASDEFDEWHPVEGIQARSRRRPKTEALHQGVGLACGHRGRSRTDLPCGVRSGV